MVTTMFKNKENFPTATFWIVHKATLSRAIVQVVYKNKKPCVEKVWFTNGNVVDINGIRAVLKRAQVIFAG